MTVVVLENLSQNALSKIKTIGEIDGVRSRHDFNFTQPTLNTQLLLTVNVDSLGFLFTETVDHRIEIQHEATFDAFAFVQAYKRHGRFTLHNPNFNFISNIESNRNAHIYFHYADKRKIKVQTLFD
ncbi:uncharacterized protein EV154DRAFT_551616 [Mucor mucedo]|uniref:uncharacterized protein n=1 Tax=Mucor mucedo TaxID=29922 RepID=UPI0022210461|nr:uncharacterized protein EV154DRAFT_551616 [Mucor mucedo]KAI7891260.1 hypothetical protein EV154DRAFT_551616 [Mucor mucedo]